jgi:hypothetical protein
VHVRSPFRRLQDETARVEDELVKPAGIDALLRCFAESKTNSFENLLDPLLKILRLSSPLAAALAAKPAFIRRITDKLTGSGKAVVRLNLLRVLRAAADAHPNRAVLVERHGLYEFVRRLSREDGAVLVRELAREIVPSLRPALRPSPSPSRHARKGSSHTPRTRSPPPVPPLPAGTMSNMSLSGGVGMGLSPPRAGLAPRMGRRTVSDTLTASPPRHSPLAALAAARPRIRHTKSRTHVGHANGEGNGNGHEHGHGHGA